MQETLRGERKIGKLYVKIGVERRRAGPSSVAVLMKDNYGKTVEEYREAVEKSERKIADYVAAVKSLEVAAKHCRGRIYVFTESRPLINHLRGGYRIKNKAIFKKVMEVKFLEGFFDCVRFFYIRRDSSEKI